MPFPCRKWNSLHLTSDSVPCFKSHGPFIVLIIYTNDLQQTIIVQLFENHIDCTLQMCIEYKLINHLNTINANISREMLVQLSHVANSIPPSEPAPASKAFEVSFLFTSTAKELQIRTTWSAKSCDSSMSTAVYSPKIFSKFSSSALNYPSEAIYYSPP